MCVASILFSRSCTEVRQCKRRYVRDDCSACDCCAAGCKMDLVSVPLMWSLWYHRENTRASRSASALLFGSSLFYLSWLFCLTNDLCVCWLQLFLTVVLSHKYRFHVHARSLEHRDRQRRQRILRELGVPHPKPSFWMGSYDVVATKVRSDLSLNVSNSLQTHQVALKPRNSDRFSFSSPDLRFLHNQPNLQSNTRICCSLNLCQNCCFQGLRVALHDWTKQYGKLFGCVSQHHRTSI